MVGPENIQVLYSFNNPLFEDYVNSPLRQAWKKLLQLLLNDIIREIDSNIYELPTTGLRELVTASNPEQVDDVEEQDLHLPKMDEDDIASIRMDLTHPNRARLTFNTIEEIELFDLLILNKFPTYLQHDAGLQDSDSHNRLPISHVPERELVDFRLYLSPEVSEEYRACGLEYTIQPPSGLTPSRELLEELIFGHISHQLLQCDHEGHTKLQELKMKYQLTDDELELVNYLNNEANN